MLLDPKFRTLKSALVSVRIPTGNSQPHHLQPQLNRAYPRRRDLLSATGAVHHKGRVSSHGGDQGQVIHAEHDGHAVRRLLRCALVNCDCIYGIPCTCNERRHVHCLRFTDHPLLHLAPGAYALLVAHASVQNREPAQLDISEPVMWPRSRSWWHPLPFSLYILTNVKKYVVCCLCSTMPVSRAGLPLRVTLIPIC